jgi:glycosyltransferase involved in cell wall biosynthesis
LIVADDGSADGTVEMISSLEEPRVRALQLGHSGNIAAVRNAGVKGSFGQWLTFLDSDDLWVPKKLEIQLDLLRKEQKRWGYGRFELMNEGGQTIPNKAGTYVAYPGWIVRELLSSEASVNIGSMMVERRLFEEAGGFDESPGLICREDYELALRLSLLAPAAAATDLLVRVREHRGRTTGQCEGHERMATAYRHFIALGPGKPLARIAGRKKAFHLAEAYVGNMRNGKRLQAIRQLGGALWGRDSWRHLISSFLRGLSARRRKYDLQP